MRSSSATVDADAATTAGGVTTSTPTPSYRTAAPLDVKLPVLALASGGLLFLCHFPVAWGWLGWVALVPLLPLVRAETRGWWRYSCAWLAGTAYFWPAISWMTVADDRMIACWAMLSLYCTLYFPLAIYLVRCLDRGTRLPLVLIFPTIWTGLEFVRSFFGTGFPWYLLAHTQHDALYVIQIADLGGAFAVSFLVAAINVILFEAITIVLGLASSGRKSAGLSARFALRCAFVALMLGATLAYGAFRLSQTDFEAGPRIALLQGNLDQRLRIAAHHSAAAQAKAHAAYQDLCRQAASLSPRPDLIVWPETSYPFIWLTVAPKIDTAKLPADFQNKLALEREQVLFAGASARTNVLLGLNTLMLDEGNERRYNSALLVDAQGNEIQRYDKIHRVPFGEYVPLRDWLPFMNRFAPYDFDYSIGCGDGLTRFQLGNFHFGVVICYEDTDPSMARDYGVKTADGPAVDFLLNISNDGWFNGSSEHEEHLAISRFRAIETRRALARSVNMGISAVIDSNGRVLAPTKQSKDEHEVWFVPKCDDLSPSLATAGWHDFKKTEGILIVEMPIDKRTSLYAEAGDWLPYSCWGLIGLGLVWSWRRRAIGVNRPVPVT
jgi:apolipoprotein N-acyltransferase